MVLLSVGLLPAAAGAQARPTEQACDDVAATPFTDVGDAGSVLERAVACVYAYEVTAGTTSTTFSPGSTLTRGQLALFVYRTLQLAGELDGDGLERAFTDIVGGELEEAANVLADLGVIDGYGDGTYRPGLQVTRGQSAKLVAGMLAAAGVDLPATPVGAFTDTVGSPFATPVAQLAELGIVNGTTPTTFSPGDPLTRSQMAYILSRSLALLVEQELIEGRAPVDPPDTTAPTLVATDPADGEVDVPLATEPSATFDEDLAATSTAWMVCNAELVDGEVAVEGATVTFTPDAPVDSAIVCVVTFEVSDVAGNAAVAGVAFSTEPDVAGPQVVSTTPADDDSGVLVGAEVSATFDEPLDPGASAGAVICAGEIVSVSPSVDDTVVVLDRADDLPFGTVCTVVFGVTDLQGNRSVTAAAFRTEADTYPPALLEVVPADGDVDVAVDVTPTATYDQAVATATASIVCGDDELDLGDGPSIDGADVVVEPAADLPDDADCELTLTVADPAGNETETTVAFATEDLTAPALDSSAPAEGDVGVAVATTPSALYDEALGDDSTASLVCGDDTVSGSSSVDGPLLTFVPAADLPDSASCVATFGAVDVVGNAAEQVVVGFTTVDLSAPTIVSASPATGASAVPLDVGPSATFGEALDPAASSASLTCGDPAQPVEGETAVDGDTITFTPADTIDDSTGCVATFTGVDLVGNVAAPVGIVFSTVDLTDPVLLSTEPAPDAIDVVVGTTPMARYGELLDPDTSDATLVCGDVALEGEVEVEEEDDGEGTIAFEPAADLPGGVSCVATFVAVDLAGNTADPVVIGFTTAAPVDIAPPFIVSTDAVQGATSFTVTFNEPVDPIGAVTASRYRITNGTRGSGPAASVALIAPGQAQVALSTPLDCTTGNVTLWWNVPDLAGNFGFSAAYVLVPSCLPPPPP